MKVVHIDFVEYFDFEGNYQLEGFVHIDFEFDYHMVDFVHKDYFEDCFQIDPYFHIVEDHIEHFD